MSGLKGTFLTRLADVDTEAKEVLGTLRYEGNKVYKYCQIKNTTATVAGAAGSLVGYGAAGGYTNNLVVLDLTDADANPIPAGALCGTVTGTAGTSYYGWVQIRGACTLDTAVVNGANGSAFTLSTTDKTGTLALAADVERYAGVSVNATTAVALDCLF